MQQKILNLVEEHKGFEMPAGTHLSFKPFLDYLSFRLQNEDAIKKEILAFVLSKFKAYPELEEEISLDKLPNYKELLDLMQVALTNVVQDEKEIYWGLSVPMKPLMFYGSNSLYELMNEANTHDHECGYIGNEYEAFIKSRKEHFYSFILKRFYSIEYHNGDSLVRSITDKQTGLIRHFDLNLKTDFVEVKAKSALPRIDIEMIRIHAIEEDALSLLQQILPVDMFTFSGFTIVTITDVSSQYALDSIRDNIVRNKIDFEKGQFPQIVKSLKELVGSNDLEFNILPLFKVNGKLLEDMGTHCQSILFSAGQEQLAGTPFLSLLQHFTAHPKLIYYGDLDVQGPSNKEAVTILNGKGVISYALLPVFYNRKLVGALEIYSTKKGLLNEKMFSALEPAKELLAQLMQNSIAAFEDEIEAVIKEKFTSLQPAVQWKFNEVAWHYLQDKKDKPAHEPEEISFENVYPLYGAVDIRNSTIERNAALQNDLRLQFDVLLRVLHTLKEQTGFALFDEKIYNAGKWADMVNPDASLFNQEVKLADFLENDIVPFLLTFTENRPELQAITEEYFRAVDKETGTANVNSRQLEKSMTTVISSVNNYFEKFKEDIQRSYPCYFEKFRTDGVEYDVYIGQSISPHMLYSDIYLKNLKLMQLTSMAAIAKFTHSLLPELDAPVETTQLIFIHSHPIDIRFRRDEKRFDVEGAYNIRYHIIKKRVDKVHLKGSDERLTQPNKIALVYFNQKEADEYISHIKYLQNQHILKEDLEHLELEELQGVSGLKALRVSVNLN